MKLNLGCGGDYKKDYINIDAFDSTVADRIMPASDLELNDNTVDEILASQIIEHLGIAGSIHMLSECFRVLKPGKKLIIETPDLQKSFKKYVEGDRESRKNLLPWIYGVDIPGMIHRFCYPDDLLEEILEKIGFTNTKKEYFEIDPYEPVLKITCYKQKEFQSFQIAANFRKKLLSDENIDLDNQLTSLEKEELIDFFAHKIKIFMETKDIAILNEIIINGAIQSPRMTHIFLDLILSKELISKEVVKDYFDILNFLDGVDFPNLLLHILRQTPEFVGEQEKLFKTICDFGARTIEKLLKSDKKEESMDNLKKISKSIDSYQKIAFFSQKLIMLKANRLFEIGTKEFILGNQKEATKKFMDSANLYRNQILTYWNLGRLLYLQDKKDEAIYHYKNALKLADIFDYKNKTNIKNSLEDEMNNHDIKICSEPAIIY